MRVSCDVSTSSRKNSPIPASWNSVASGIVLHSACTKSRDASSYGVSAWTLVGAALGVEARRGRRKDSDASIALDDALDRFREGRTSVARRARASPAGPRPRRRRAGGAKRWRPKSRTMRAVARRIVGTGGRAGQDAGREGGIREACSAGSWTAAEKYTGRNCQVATPGALPQVVEVTCRGAEAALGQLEEPGHPPGVRDSQQI